MLAWDMDSSFGAFPPTATREQKATLDLYNPKLTADPRPLVDRILGNPQWQEGWLKRIATLRKSVFAPDKLEQQARQLWQLVGPELKTDPRLIYGYAAAVQGLDADVDAADPVRRYPEPFPGLVPFFHARAAAIDAQLASPTHTWPRSEPFVTVDSACKVAVEGAAPDGDLYVYVQGQDVAGITQTYLVRSAHGAPQVAFNTMLSAPGTLTEAKVVAFLDVGEDGWIDPGVDRWGMVAVPLPNGLAAAGRIDGNVVIQAPWSGGAIWASKFGAPTGL